MRSGHVNPDNSAGPFRNPALEGAWWSSRSATASSANHLLFNATVTKVSLEDARYYGTPLRCLSTVLGMGGDGGYYDSDALAFTF